MISIHRLRRPVTFTFLALAVCMPSLPVQATDKKPNIVIIWGDDIGQSNVSAYSKGMMGYRTPNIDRVANEGVIFTDYYADAPSPSSSRLRTRV